MHMRIQWIEKSHLEGLMDFAAAPHDQHPLTFMQNVLENVHVTNLRNNVKLGSITWNNGEINYLGNGPYTYTLY